MTKKIILINLMIAFVLIISLELIFNFFKLSALMGIQSGLIYSKNDNFFLSPKRSGIVFDEKVFTEEATRLETFEDALALARKLFAYAKVELEQQKKEEDLLDASFEVGFVASFCGNLAVQ